jgi:hypothetical protein
MLLFKKDLINVVKAAKGYVTSVANTNSKNAKQTRFKKRYKVVTKIYRNTLCEH